jgi:hypothetical protein
LAAEVTANTDVITAAIKMRFIQVVSRFLLLEVARGRLPHTDFVLALSFLGAILLTSILSTPISICKGNASVKLRVVRSDRPTHPSCQA